MDDRGVPVQDDWSTAPDDDMVRFSLSGVPSHSSPRCGADSRWDSCVSDSLQERSSSSSCNTEEFWEMDLERDFLSLSPWLPQLDRRSRGDSVRTGGRWPSLP